MDSDELGVGSIVGLDDAIDFFKSGFTTEGGENAFLLKGQHTLLTSDGFDFSGIDFCDIATEEFSNRVSND